MTEISSSNADYPQPVRVAYEDWQAELLAKRFYENEDPVFSFGLGTGFNEQNLQRFFSAFLRGLEESEGSIFATSNAHGEPDHRGIIGWRWFGAAFPLNRYDEMLEVFDADGRDRYEWFRAATDRQPGDFGLDPDKTVRPHIMAIDKPRSEAERWRGLGRHLLKGTVHLQEQKGTGYETFFTVVSTSQWAGSQQRLLGFPYSEQLQGHQYPGPIPEGKEGFLATMLYKYQLAADSSNRLEPAEHELQQDGVHVG